jgi:hypothetical protein
MSHLPALPPSGRRDREIEQDRDRDRLAGWDVHLAESQTLVRLVLALLQGTTPLTPARRVQLSGLLRVEARGLARLEPLGCEAQPRTSGLRLSAARAVPAEIGTNLQELGAVAAQSLGRAAEALLESSAAAASLLERAQTALRLAACGLALVGARGRHGRRIRE